MDLTPLYQDGNQHFDGYTGDFTDEGDGVVILFLTQNTNTDKEDWESIDGPDSGVGVDFYFRHKDGREAYINLDQCYLSGSVMNTDEDE